MPLIIILIIIFLIVWHSKKKKAEKEAKAEMTKQVKKEPTANNVIHITVKSNLRKEPLFGFPEKLENGKEATMARRYKVVGSQHSHFGNVGYNGIENLEIGDAVILKADPENEFDNTAIAVFNEEDEYCGWLPKKQEALFNFIVEEGEWKAKVIDKYVYDDDSEWRIDVGIVTYVTPKNKKG